MCIKWYETSGLTVLQGDCAPLAGGGEPAVQRDLEEDPENSAVRLSSTTQFCLHLIWISREHLKTNHQWAARCLSTSSLSINTKRPNFADMSFNMVQISVKYF